MKDKEAFYNQEFFLSSQSTTFADWATVSVSVEAT